MKTPSSMDEGEEHVVTRMNRLKEMYDLRKVPFDMVPHEYCRQMAMLLQPPSDADWKQLAHLLGVPIQNTRAIPTMYRPDLDGLCGLNVFEWYCKLQDNNVLELVTKLKEMQRFDVLNIICDALPGIMHTLKRPLVPSDRVRSPVPMKCSRGPQAAPNNQENVVESSAVEDGMHRMDTDNTQLVSIETTSSFNSRLPTEEFENDCNPFIVQQPTPFVEGITRSDYGIASVSDQSGFEQISRSHLNHGPVGPYNFYTHEHCQMAKDMYFNPSPTQNLPRPIQNDHDCMTATQLQPRGLQPPGLISDRALSPAQKQDQVNNWLDSHVSEDSPAGRKSPNHNSDEVVISLSALSLRHTLPKSVKNSPEDIGDGRTKRSVSAGAELQKSLEHAKAPRQQRIYITYSKDFFDGAVKLQSYLRENGFRVALDNHSSLSNMSCSPIEYQKEIKRRFAGANFVIVCVTPEYRRIWDHSFPSNNNSGVLTTDSLSPCNVVYAFMRREYEKKKNACSRYIVVRCNKADKSAIPKFLSDNCAVYKFPKEYKSFLMYLAKPRAIVDQFIEQERSTHSKPA